MKIRSRMEEMCRKITRMSDEMRWEGQRERERESGYTVVIYIQGCESSAFQLISVVFVAKIYVFSFIFSPKLAFLLQFCIGFQCF